MVQAVEFRLGRSFLGRLPEGQDPLVALADFCREKGVRAGWLSAIGTLRRAVLGYFDETRREYLRIPVEGFREIASCQGNVSLRDGQPFVHLHIVLSAEDGSTVAGHLLEGETFVGEFYLQEVLGPALVRQFDPQSGLALWTFP